MADSPDTDPVGNDLRERLTRAFDEHLARDIPYFGGGGLGYYGVRLEDIAPDGSELDLVVTLRSGDRYCCSQTGCHFDFRRAAAWSELREHLDAQGLRAWPLPTIRRLRVVVEDGALFDPGGLRSPPLTSRGYAHEEGPFPPVIGPDKDGGRASQPD